MPEIKKLGSYCICDIKHPVADGNIRIHTQIFILYTFNNNRRYVHEAIVYRSACQNILTIQVD